MVQDRLKKIVLSKSRVKNRINLFVQPRFYNNIGYINIKSHALKQYSQSMMISSLLFNKRAFLPQFFPLSRKIESKCFKSHFMSHHSSLPVFSSFYSRLPLSMFLYHLSLRPLLGHMISHFAPICWIGLFKKISFFVPSLEVKDNPNWWISSYYFWSQRDWFCICCNTD